MAADIKQLSCKNYSLFIFSEMNRLTIDGETCKPRKDLVDSMTREGFRKTSPIVCVPAPGGKFKIVDGHNRFVAARHLKLPVEYIVYPKGDEISPVAYSQAQKSWTCAQVAHGYAIEGREDYAEIVDFSNATGIHVSYAFPLFLGRFGQNDCDIQGRIRDGSYKITDRETPWRLANAYIRITRLAPHAASATLLRALDRALRVEDFDVESLIDKIEKNPRMLVKCRTQADAIEMLGEVYNYKRRGDKYYLEVEIEKAMRVHVGARNARHNTARAIARAKKSAEAVTA